MFSFPPFQILQAGLHDLGGVRRVEQACFAEDAWPLLDLIAVLTLPGIVRLKVVTEESMVAFAAAELRPGDGLGWITTIGVLPDYRQRGIGKALLEACEQQAGFPRVRLCVRKSNQLAIRMYEHAGYTLVDIWSHYYLGGEDALVMEKKR
ncbi:MAG: N-acetyltransferase [Anaerolineaceae bacterium]|jgi:ribosomal-protein-alanine N-acetyltransferase